jgi:hypothetical protein
MASLFRPHPAIINARDNIPGRPPGGRFARMRTLNDLPRSAVLWAFRGSHDSYICKFQSRVWKFQSRVWDVESYV